MMDTPSGISVSLSVSASSGTVAVPNVTGMNYNDALAAISAAGLNGEIENATSDTVAKDIVISSSPMADEQLSEGATVYIRVSGGPEIIYTEVPNLIGLTEDQACAKLESLHLTYGGSVLVNSEQEVGTVVGQEPVAFTQVEEHAKVSLQISSGAGG